jgi:hypothetical protein
MPAIAFADGTRDLIGIKETDAFSKRMFDCQVVGADFIQEVPMRKFPCGLLAVSVIIAVTLANPAAAQPYGSGMMGSYGPGYGMMGPGYGAGWMMGPGYGPGMMGWGSGYGPGWMMRGGYGPGPGIMYGYGPNNQGDLSLTVDQVKQYLNQMIRNPNLIVGDVKEKDAYTIVAEIVTKQGNSLVQKLDFNRHNGFVQPEQ